MITLDDEQAEHAPAIAALHRAAFGGAFEAHLVERLHRDGLVLVSLVALDKDDVVGHVLLSRLAVALDGRAIEAAALAPVAVRPERQRQGIGAALIRAALDRTRTLGIEAIFVLGHAEYYPRFGFSPALAAKFEAPFRGDTFMALALSPGALAGTRGFVRYPKAFVAD